MAIIVEDGTQVANSNSYVTEAELTTFAAERGVTIVGSNDQLLLRANDYLETLNFIGDRLTKTQSIQWPRSNAGINGFDIDEDEIPSELKTAQLYLALSIDAGNDPLATRTADVKREKVDVIEVEYQPGASTSSPYITSAQRYLSKLVKGGSTGGLGIVAVTRA